MSIQRICVVTLLRVIRLQAAFGNQLDTTVHPAAVIGLVGVLEGFAHSACRQAIGINAMFNEVLANGIGTTLRQVGVVLVAADPVGPTTDFNLFRLVSRIDDRERLVQNTTAFFRKVRLVERKVDALNFNCGSLLAFTIEDFFDKALPQGLISHQSFKIVDTAAGGNRSQLINGLSLLFRISGRHDMDAGLRIGFIEGLQCRYRIQMLLIGIDLKAAVSHENGCLRLGKLFREALKCTAFHPRRSSEHFQTNAELLLQIGLELFRRALLHRHQLGKRRHSQNRRLHPGLLNGIGAGLLDEAVRQFMASQLVNLFIGWRNNTDFRQRFATLTRFFNLLLCLGLHIPHSLHHGSGHIGDEGKSFGGGIVINGALTSSAAPSVTANQVSVAANGMLIVNQQNVGDKQVFSTSDDAGTTVTFAAGSYLGLVNAQEGTLALADTVTADDNAKVVTDNPFFTGAFVTNEAGATVVTTSFDSDSGLSAIASTGIQSMARRADFVMSETVANRTSLDQQLNAGVNLWVDVTGERYESDKLDNNGSFRADAGYAMFGGDVQVADGLTAGLALQYGDATVRSDVASIKNEINSYGLTAYVGQTFGAAKVVGEVSWLRTENDITSSQTALNQSLDTNVYSAGLRAQYELTAGAFKFIPSIGLRVSHLETDDMTIGAINASTSDLTYVQMPIALRITGAEVNASGWTFAPSFKIAYVPTFGDKDIKFYGASQNVLDMSPVQADFGLRAVNGNLMFNADMMIGGGEYGTSSVGGKVGVKYVF